MTSVLDRSKSMGAIFIVTVAIPTILAIAYFGFLASDVFISESRFVVRSPGRVSASPLGVFLGASGFTNAGEESYAVVDYVRSREALAEANRDGLVTKVFQRPDASFLDRFGGPFGGTSAEHLYRYFGAKVQIEYDTSTQITKLTVRAFNPVDSRRINERLLEQSEKLINRLSERGRRDAIVTAQLGVDAARDKARNAAVALTRFRNEKGIIDPEKQAAINLQMMSKLQDALIAQQTQLAQLQAYTPKNPQIPSIKIAITNIRREIDRQGARVAGSANSLSSVASTYQQLVFDAEFASKQLAVSLASLQEAMTDASKKQVYVERIANPNQPDHPLEPRRTRSILATFLLGLLVWGVATTLVAGIREHRD